MFYDAFFTNISDNTAANSPNATGKSITPDPTGRGLFDPLTVIANATATPNPQTTVWSVDSNLRNPLIHQWNLNVQRELPSRIKAEVAYVGTRGERLWVNEQLNREIDGGSRIYTNRGSLVIRGNRGDSIYHGLQTSVSRQVGNFAIRGSYTYSRLLDNGSDVFVTSGGASRWQNVLDPAATVVRRLSTALIAPSSATPMRSPSRITVR